MKRRKKDHFEARFKKPVDHRFKLNFQFHKILLKDQADDLERGVSRDEIRRAVDLFFEAIKMHFFTSGGFSKGCNSSFVTLIPKIIDAKFVNDFRPISLIGCVYKVVTKVLANRLVSVIGDLVSDTQSAFVAGRQILDGPFILEKLKWVINALYGSKVASHQTHYSSNWCSILREVHKLKDKGFDFWYHIKKRIGNGADTSFWYDCWFGDIPFCVKYPRLFALELDKQVSVESKLLSSMESSFRRNVRGGIEQHMLRELTSTLETEVRNCIDDIFLPSQVIETRWVRRDENKQFISCVILRSSSSSICRWWEIIDLLIGTTFQEWYACSLSVRYLSKSSPPPTVGRALFFRSGGIYED
ncbi:hypothetical protein Tco_0421140 [Tanacetum coccineum]